MNSIVYESQIGTLDDIVHPNATDYPNQRIFVIQIQDYVYLVPYVESQDEIFLIGLTQSAS